MESIEKIRPEVIHDFIRHLKLQVSADFYLNLTRQYMESARYVDASVCIIKHRLYPHFDILELCLKLVELDKVQQVKMLAQSVKGMKEQVVRRLDRLEHIKVAQLLIKDFKLNCDDFPEFKKLVTVESSNYFIKRAFEAPDHPEFVPPHKVEDLFDGNAPMLLSFVKELLH